MKRWLGLGLALVFILFIIGVSAHLRRSRAELTCHGCNLLLVSIDTLRADHLGTYGYQKPTSPNLDALAADSVVFDRAYSSSAWTFPAHLSILTGRFPHRPSEIMFGKVQPLNDSYVTLAESLRAAGYRTAAFVGGGWVREGLGFPQGFEVFHSSGMRFENNAALVGRWLDRRDSERPFFLFVHGYNVHRPYDTESKYVPTFVGEVPPRCLGVEFRDHEAAKGECIADEAGHRYAIGLYDSEIRGVDDYLGGLLERLHREGLFDDTVVVVLSDHGDEFWDHGGQDHTNTLYDELIRVPIILHVPGTRPRRVPAPVSLVDVTPTLLDVLGLKDTVERDGISWRSRLDRLPQSRAIFAVTGRDDHWAHQHRGGAFWLQAVVKESLKLIVRHDAAGDTAACIFNQAVDPREQKPRSRPSARRDAMETLLLAWRTQIGLPDDLLAEPLEDSVLDSETRSQLKTLGYLE